MEEIKKGRIINIISNIFYVEIDNNIKKCTSRGIFKDKEIKPVVGDIVKVNIKEDVDYSWKDTNYSATGDKKRPMTKKNMHTFEGHTVTSDKIEIITDESGKPRTTWDVFKEMALVYKKEYPDKKYLPVEEWQEDGKFNHEKDYLSMFIEIEKSENEKKNIRNVVEKFARDKDVALKKEEAKAVFKQLEMENENIQESPSLSE